MSRYLQKLLDLNFKQTGPQQTVKTVKTPPSGSATFDNVTNNKRFDGFDSSPTSHLHEKSERVAAAPLTPTDTGYRVCAQCNAPDDGTVIEHRHGGDTVWVHKDCRRFWDRSRGQVHYGESDDEALG
jgi:hypothetical protein